MPAKKPKAKKPKFSNSKQAERYAFIYKLLQENDGKFYDPRDGKLRRHSKKTIAKEMEKLPPYGIGLEASEKTIGRDLVQMEKAMNGVRIWYEDKRPPYGYVMKLPADVTGANMILDINESDLFGMMVFEPVLKQYEGTPIGLSLQGTFDKLKNVMTDALKVAPDDINSAMSIKETKVPIQNMEHLRKLLTAVRRGHPVNARYYRPNKPEKDYTLWPYNCANVNGTWYLYAIDKAKLDETGKPEMGVFKLGRFKKVEVLEKESIKKLKGEDGKPYRFDINNHTDWGVIKRGKTVPVEVRFRPECADYLNEKKWHHSQQLAIDPDTGHVHMRLELNADMREFSAWLKTWGEAFEVLEPESLREEMQKVGTRMAITHGADIEDIFSDDATESYGGDIYLDEEDDDD